MAETRQMLDVYADFAENFMAMPVLTGERPKRNASLVRMLPSRLKR